MYYDSVKAPFACHHHRPQIGLQRRERQIGRCLMHTTSLRHVVGPRKDPETKSNLVRKLIYTRGRGTQHLVLKRDRVEKGSPNKAPKPLHSHFRVSVGALHSCECRGFAGLWQAIKANTPHDPKIVRGICFDINLAPCYFSRGLCPKYLRRSSVSRPCSEWERVGPPRHRHQKSSSPRGEISVEGTPCPPSRRDTSFASLWQP